MIKGIRVGLRLIFFSAAIGTVLAGFGVVGRRPVVPLRFEPHPFVILEPMNSMSEYDHFVDLVNDNDEPARLIGVGEFCASSCFASQGLPLTIPARGRASVNLHVKAYAPGSLEEEIQFYTDRPTQPTLTLKFQGRVVEKPNP